MKDSIKLMCIYRHYLSITSKLIEVLEHYTAKADKDISPELKKKYKEFRNHAHKLIEYINQDLHFLIKLDFELKEMENNENAK